MRCFMLSIMFTTLLCAFCAQPLLADEIIIPIDHYPPWKIVNSPQNITGINVEISKRLLEKLGLKPVFISRPWKRCQLMMKKGTADLMNGLLKRADREEYMFFIEPPYKTKSSKAFYVRKGDMERINKYEDLTGLTIGVTLGTKYFKRFDSDRTLHKEQVNESLANLKKLAAGRLDTFVSTETVADYLILENNLMNKIEKSNYVYEKPIPVYYAISKKSALIKRLPELKQALEEMVDSGEIEKIIENYTH